MANVENSGAASYFCWNIFFRILCKIESPKEQRLFEIEIFCNNVQF